MSCAEHLLNKITNVRMTYESGRRRRKCSVSKTVFPSLAGAFEDGLKYKIGEYG